MTLATNDLGRVFLFPGGVNACNQLPIYGDCFSVDGLSQDNGDVTRIECPDPYQYGKYVEVAITRGENGRLTTSLSKRMKLEEVAILRSMFDNDCPVDIHIHWGLCTDPTQFNQYILAWVLQDVYVTSWSTDTAIAFQSSDRAPVVESIDISAGKFWQILATLKYAQSATALTTAPIVDIALCDNKTCAGDACPPSSGCDKLYAIDNTGDMFVSLDGGGIWEARTLPALATELPVGLACVGANIIVAYDNGSIGYINRTDLDRNVVANFVTVTGVIPALSGDPSAVIGANTSFGPIMLIGTTTGFIYQIDNNLVVTLLDNSNAGGAAINGIVSDGETVIFLVASGLVLVQREAGGIIVPTLDAPTATVLLSGVVKSRNHWLVAGEDGGMWCTLDGGCSWVAVTIAGLGAGDDITDLCMSSKHVLWGAIGGIIYRSIDGGSSWVQEPNDTSPGCRVAAAALGTITKLACCVHDQNKVVGVGTTTGAAGLILLGRA